MTEIEQLRKDIETLEAAEGVFRRKYGQDYKQYNTELARMRKRLAKLEAEAAAKADPWREHKEVLSGRFHTQQGADHDEKLVLNYAMHLQQTNEKMALKSRLDNARIAELEAELAKRPVVWCLRNKETGEYKKFSPTSGIALYSNANFATFSDWKFEPYTGEQS